MAAHSAHAYIWQELSSFAIYLPKPQQTLQPTAVLRSKFYKSSLFITAQTT